MSYKLISRFQYTLNFFTTLLSFWNIFYNVTSISVQSLIFKNNPTYFANNARSLLRILLSSVSSKKLNIGIQAYTCNTVFQAINKAGHDIVFIDINNSYGIALNDLKRKINCIDVLIITHTFGFPSNIEKIQSIAKNKIIIEDCAHAFLSRYKKVPVGSYGDAAIFSFGFAKFPPVGQGGFALINNPEKFPLFNKNYNLLPKESTIAEIVHFFKKIIYSIAFQKPWYGLFTFPFGKKLDRKYDMSNKLCFKESKGFSIDKSIFIRNQKVFSKLVEKNKENYQALNNLTRNKFDTAFDNYSFHSTI